MSRDLILGIVAGGLHVLAFALYNKQMLQGTSRPNTATWTLWAFLTVLNLATYKVMSGDWIKSILPTISSIACLATFLFAIVKGKLTQLNVWDNIALLIGIASAVVWWQFHSATYANLILQGSIAVSFVPTYRGVWQNPRNEKALPWFIWSSAYIISLLVIFLRWQGQYQDLVYPINCLVLHGAVGVMAKRT